MDEGEVQERTVVQDMGFLLVRSQSACHTVVVALNLYFFSNDFHDSVCFLSTLSCSLTLTSISQYSQYYTTVAPPTPQTSIAIPTVGGRGAMPVVLDNEPVPAAVDHVDTTTIAFGQAEPGRDIFAEKAADPKSAARVEGEPAEAQAAAAVSTDAEVSEVKATEEIVHVHEEAEDEAEKARKELFPEAEAAVDAQEAKEA
jgi:hypothetical protein